MDRSLIWFWLGRMSRHGLLPIPIDDISSSRISAQKGELAGETPLIILLRHKTLTSIFSGLHPQETGKLLRPRVLYILRHTLKCPRVIALSFPEPDLELCRRVAHMGRQTYVGRLNAVLVNVEVQILRKRGHSLTATAHGT